MQDMKVRLKGRDYRISRKSVEGVLRLPPDRTGRYVVDVRRRLYPVKQAFAVGVGSKRGWHTHRALRALTALGFQVLDLKDCKRKRASKPTAARRPVTPRTRRPG